MISALQTKFQKHHKIVFVVLLAVIIVAFVFTIGAAPGIGGGDTAAPRQDFFGYNLASERDVREIFRMGEISYRIEFGQERFDQSHLQNFSLERTALLGLADRMGIPGPSEEQLRNFIPTRPAFQDDEGQFDIARYNTFIDEVEAHPQMSNDEVAQVLFDDYRIERVRELLGGPGYTLPTEIRLQLERNQTLWSLDIATFDLSSFQPEIEVGDEELEQFYEENSFRFERGPRTVFSYVTFTPEAFMDRVGEPTEAELQEHFQRNREVFSPPASEEENGEEEQQQEVTFEEVRPQVEESLRSERARRLASRAAGDFAYALFEDNIRPGSDHYQEVLVEYNGQEHEAPPASADHFPPELDFPRQVQQEVFRLSEDRHFSDPMSLNDGYVVLVYRDTLPAFVPPLEEIRDTVEREYRREEERRLLAERAEELHNAILEQMAEGVSFTEAAEAEGLETHSVDRFSRSSPPERVHQGLLARLDDLELGEVSPMIPLQNHGFFVHLREREVPEIDRTSEEFARTRENLRQWSSMANQNYLVQELMEREIGHDHDDHDGHDH